MRTPLMSISNTKGQVIMHIICYFNPTFEFGSLIRIPHQWSRKGAVCYFYEISFLSWWESVICIPKGQLLRCFRQSDWEASSFMKNVSHFVWFGLMLITFNCAVYFSLPCPLLVNFYNWMEAPTTSETIPRT